jgi:xanthine dehydrogenase YagR molybdenum-binding subunit
MSTPDIKTPPDGTPVPAGEQSSPARRFVTTTVEVEGREEVKIVEMPAFEPEPWGEDAELHIVGQRLPRVDAGEKVTGRARFTADVQRPGMLYAVIRRSTIPRGRATIDLAPALAVPGVLDAIDATHLERRIRAGGVGLFDPDIAYAGQPLAAVCGETLDAAEEGARAIVVSYEPAPFVATFAAAVADDAPRARPGSKSAGGGGSPNIARTSPSVAERGDTNAGLREADVVVHREYRTPVAVHTPLEPHGAVAEWDGDRLTVWESTQGIFMVRANVAKALDLPHSSVRVIKDYMGGGFGAKNSAGAYTYAAAILARRTGRPVRCVNDRDAEQTDAGNRPATVQRVTLGARRDGRLTAILCEADIAFGIGGWEAPPTKIYHEMYSCPNVRTVDTFVYSNTSAMTAFRGPGHVEGAFGLECAMDALARELGMDPLALRLANYAEHDEEKNRPYSAKRLRECYAEGARRFGWNRKSGIGNPESRAADRGVAVGVDSRHPIPGSRRRGTGMATQVWPTGGGPPAYAIVKLNGDGSADVLTGTQDLGTGARTIFAQIAAESLGARVSDVRVVLGDTERTPYTGNSWGSMTTPSVGPAVRMAAEDARRQLLDAAAEMLEVPASELAARDSIVTTLDGAKSITFAEIGDRLGDLMILGHGSRGPNTRGVGIMSFGAQFAEVEVDVETGVVRVLRLTAVHDAGRIINPTLAESQLEGGIIQGLGYALFEERVVDQPLGRVLNPTMHEYKIPTMADMPHIDAGFIDRADPTANHTGARGLAEPPIIPTAPAIANAVADALGVDVREIPLTPWRVLAALRGDER